MPETTSLHTIGAQLRLARLAAGLTQEQVAELAGIALPRYRDIETGAAAARATTLMNVARALGLEMMLIPQFLVPAVNTLLSPETGEDAPAFIPQPEPDDER